MIEIHIIPIKELYSLLEETSIDNSVAVIASSEEIDLKRFLFRILLNISTI